MGSIDIGFLCLEWRIINACFDLEILRLLHLPRQLSALPDLLEQYLAAPRWLIGASGGCDSMCLLSCIAGFINTRRERGKPVPELLALHINHGLQADADQWQRDTEQWAEACGVVCQSVQVVLDAEQVKQSGIERSARDARYQVFEAQVRPSDVLMLAHHQQDQVETFFLRAMRGAGVQGLAGIPVVRAIGAGTLLRPLMGISRTQIEQYMLTQQLPWIDDPSNENVALDRNYLRQQVLPMLRQRWPAMDAVIARDAEQLRESAGLLDELAQSDLAEIEQPDAWWSKRLSITALRRLSAARLRNCLHYYCRQLSGYAPSGGIIDVLINDIVMGASDNKAMCDIGANYRVQGFQDHLYYYQSPSAPERLDQMVLQQGENNIDLAALGCINISLKQAGHYRLAYRQDGDQINLPDRGRRSVKKLLLELGVPPWWRDYLPIVYQQQDDVWQLIAIADLVVSDEALIVCCWDRISV